jgi:hypothetical protein
MGSLRSIKCGAAFDALRLKEFVRSRAGGRAAINATCLAGIGAAMM